jgi:hypothetical protein
VYPPPPYQPPAGYAPPPGYPGQPSVYTRSPMPNSVLNVPHFGLTRT